MAMKFKSICLFCIFYLFASCFLSADTWTTLVTTKGVNNSGSFGSYVASLPSGDLVIVGQYKADEVVLGDINLSSITDASKLVSQDRSKIYLARISAGKFIWAKTFGSKDDADNPVIRVRTDAEGNIYVLGASTSSVTIDNTTIHKTGKDAFAFLAKFNENGELIWGKSIEAFNNVEETDLVVSQAGDIVVVTSVTQNIRRIKQDKITYNRPGSYSSAIIIRFDKDGNALWIKGTVSEGAGSASIAKSAVLDKESNLYIVGEFSGGKLNLSGASLPLPTGITSSPAYGCVFLAKYDVEGNCVMAANMGSNLSVAHSRPKAFKVSLSEDESKIYVTGSFSKSLAIWDKAGEKELNKFENNGRTTFFITQVSQEGEIENTKTGETRNCYVEIAGFQQVGNNYVLIGNFAGNMDIGDGKKYVSTSNRTISRQKYFPFIIKYDANWEVSSCDIIEANGETKIKDFCVSNSNICAIGTFVSEVSEATLGTNKIEMDKKYSKSFVYFFK